METHPVTHGQEVWGCFSRNTEVWSCFSARNITSPWSWILLEPCVSQVPVIPAQWHCRVSSLRAALRGLRLVQNFWMISGCAVGVWGSTHGGSVGVLQ